MKRKVSLVNFSDKENDLIAQSLKMTPEERIELLFELIELSNLFKPAGLSDQAKDELPFVVLKKKQI
jgi:hypothetical protein